MTPTHARKGGKHYRYYVSASLIRGTSNGNTQQSTKGWRVPTGDIERLVDREMITLLGDASALDKMLKPHIGDAIERNTLTNTASEFARRWPGMAMPEKRDILMAVINRVIIRSGSIDLLVHLDQLASILNGQDHHDADKHGDDRKMATLSTPAKLKRAGMETRLMIEGQNDANTNRPDDTLIQLLARAHDYQAALLSGGRSIAEMAMEAGVTSSYFTRVVRLGFLAPDIIKSIVRGERPPHLTARWLASNTRLPIGWEDQRKMLGFD